MVSHTIQPSGVVSFCGKQQKTGLQIYNSPEQKSGKISNQMLETTRIQNVLLFA